MEKFKVKEEFIKRYKYIYENSKLILLPYIYINFDNNKPTIGLKKIDEFLLFDIESFLLSDIDMENSNLFKIIESKKNNTEELLKIKSTIELIKDSRINIIDGMNYDFGNVILDDWDVLLLVCSFIKKQEKKNKTMKKELDALDSYFEIARYTNDGKIWTGGRYRSAYDNYNGIHPKEKEHRIIEKSISENNKIKSNMKVGTFINTISEYKSSDIKFLSEEEKEMVYFSLHDEIPWNLEIECNLNESSLNSNEYKLPKCIKKVRVEEDKIFINPNEEKNRYLLLCPYCGRIINVNKELLTDGIKARIEKRCQEDPYLFKKMCLYSELQLLNNIDLNNEKKLAIKR